MRAGIGKMLFMLCVLAFAAHAADPRWDVPPLVPEAALPKLGPIEVDGVLAEWDAAAAVPLRFASYIGHRVPAHAWQGPVDCSMEVLCGWSSDGLCLAGVVMDDDVRNDRSTGSSSSRTAWNCMWTGGWVRPPDPAKK